jgi:hypothetical protein
LKERSRTKREKLVYTLDFIEKQFLAGIRHFAGVTVNRCRVPLYDEEQPVIDEVPAKHYLNNYIYWELIHKGPIN